MDSSKKLIIMLLNTAAHLCTNRSLISIANSKSAGAKDKNTSNSCPFNKLRSNSDNVLPLICSIKSSSSSPPPPSSSITTSLMPALSALVGCNTATDK